MTESRRYVIRRAFVFPLGVALGLLALLLMVSIHHGQPLAKLAFLVVFAIPLAVMFVACAFRTLTLDATGVRVKSPLRTRHLDFARITSVETVQVRSRVFLTLSAGDDDFLIISNSYGDFAGLVTAILQRVPPGAVTEEARRLAAAPPARYADIGMAWFTVVALIYVLAAQFRQ